MEKVDNYSLREINMHYMKHTLRTIAYVNTEHPVMGMRENRNIQCL